MHPGTSVTQPSTCNRQHAKPHRRLLAGLLAAGIPAALVACRVWAPSPSPSAEDAATFVATANESILKLGREQQQAAWVAATYITPDTQAITARANQAFIDATARNAKDAARFNSLQVAPDVRRQLELLKTTLVVVTPSDARQAEELTTLTASMEAAYGSGKWCKDPSQPATCLDIEQITEEMASSHDPARLRELWEGWHTVSIPMKKDYVRFTELANLGARELGFADTGALWRAKYDMPPDAFTKELDRLWEQVRPLYVSLHAYVRMKLHAKYGDIVPQKGPIPAHLMGNIWAQDWSNLAPLVARDSGGPAYSLSDLLKRRNTGAVEMTRTGERFFTSLGFAPLPATFWERSMLVKPADRNVVCHASAWDVDMVEDLRIKMCIDPTEEDFTTIHHELGHNFYQRAYNTLPILFRDSANDGFHEAVGDTIALSVTPEYLVKIGLLDKAPDPSGDIDLLVGAGAREGVVPALRAAGGSVAMAGVFGAGHAGPVQQGVVGPAIEISGRRAARGAWRAVLRSGREVPRAGRDAVYAILPRAHSAVPVPPRAVETCRLHGASASLLDLREQGGRSEARSDAQARTLQALARGTRSADRLARDGCDGHS